MTDSLPGQGTRHTDVMTYIIDLLENKYEQGGKLPSVRALSELFGCSKSTVLRAYKELEDRHLVYSIHKSGYYKLDPDKNVESSIDKPIDFRTVLPDQRLLPHREFHHSMSRAIDVYKDILFTYGEPQGLDALRRSLSLSLMDRHVYTKPDSVCITSGAQQALNIITRMDFPNSKQKILIEQPSYSVMLRMTEKSGKDVIGINRDHKGVDLNKLEHHFKNDDIKFFYTMPRYHNPLGTSLDESTKKAIAELAGKHDVYIVEDDYLGDLSVGSSIMPLHYYDTNGKVIYIKSLSKAFMPGLRLGLAIIPDNLKHEYIQHKRFDDLNTSVLTQAAFQLYLESGMYDKHIGKVSRAYDKKLGRILGYIKAVGNPKMEFVVPDTAFYAWVKLDKSTNAGKLTSRLKEAGVLVSPGKEFFLHEESVINAIRLCIANTTDEEIRKGFDIISGMVL